MNYIGIDPSLISTAITINGKLINYCKMDNAHGKTGLKKWFKLAENYADYRYVNYNIFKTYSEGEIKKIEDYSKISDQIISDILLTINPNETTKIAIEGYSYASNAGDIIDLVTFSTLLRIKLLKQITTDIVVLSPSTLKLESCKFTYDPIDVGKKKPKLEWKNTEGISGGKFTKREIMLSIIDNKNLNDPWTNHLRELKEDILSNKTIPKPYEDLNDSFMLYNIIKNGILI